MSIHCSIFFEWLLLCEGYKVKVFCFKVNYRVSIIKLAFPSNTNIKEYDLSWNTNFLMLCDIVHLPWISHSILRVVTEPGLSQQPNPVSPPLVPFLVLSKNFLSITIIIIYILFLSVFFFRVSSAIYKLSFIITISNNLCRS